MQVGDTFPALAVGTVVQHRDDPDLMLVQFGTNEVFCDSYLDDFETEQPEGTFVYFPIAKAPGTYSNTLVDALIVEDGSMAAYGTGTDVTLTTVGERVTGNFMYESLETDYGDIFVSGNFDVVSCL